MLWSHQNADVCEAQEVTCEDCELYSFVCDTATEVSLTFNDEHLVL
jgi:hypothetical protein